MAARRPRKTQQAQAKKRGTTRATGEAARKSGKAAPAKKASARGTSTARRAARGAPEPRPGRPRAVPAPEPVMESLDVLEPLGERTEMSPALSGGDVDADWHRAQDTGEEAVGGSVATPDQDVVDEIGRALGVEQPADGEVWTSHEILGTRDRHYWHLERKAAEEDDA